jgi:hypothetical protein
MPTRQSAGALELLLAESSPGAGRIVVLPQLPGAGVESLVGSLLQAVPGRRLLLPAPSPDGPAPRLREWHEDAWMALSDDTRSSVAVATGPTAAYLAPALGALGETVVVVREPLEALEAAQPKGVPMKRILSSLAGHEGGGSPGSLQPWSNPQSRALLGPWHDTEALAVTSGPPDDADRWRELLFDDVLSRVAVTENAAAFARRVAEALGSARKRAVRIAAALAEERPQGPRMDPAHDELLRSMSWLDVELYERCAGTAPLRATS